MLNNLFDKIYERFKLYSMDKFEKDLCRNSLLKSSDSLSFIFFQCPLDHFFLHLYSEIIKKENSKNFNYVGKIEIPISLNIFHIILIFPFLFKKISQLLLIRKWKKLYRSIGINRFESSSSFNLKNFCKALYVYFKVRTPQELSELKIKNILVGDLIIDSIIRYRNAKLPKVSVLSFNNIIFYYQALQYADFYDKLCNNYNIEKAFISQSIFIYHGVPLRQFYNNNITTYSSASLDNCIFKEIKRENDNGVPYGSEYNKIFNDNFNKQDIEISLKKFSSRFEGVDDIGWLNDFGTHPYNSNVLDSKHSFNGVLFLHDFYDGPHFYGKTLFLNFYDWTINTLDIIQEYNLKIAVKIHPFQSIQSKKVCIYLKNRYKSILWLEEVSNKSLFDSGIEFGITQHGTIISELAYHGIKPIYCGDHPIDFFQIGFKAKTIEEYKNYIINPQNLSLNPNIHNEIGKFYTVHNMYDKSDYKLENVNGFSIKGIKNRFNYCTTDLEKIYINE